MYSASSWVAAATAMTTIIFKLRAIEDLRQQLKANGGTAVTLAQAFL